MSRAAHLIRTFVGRVDANCVSIKNRKSKILSQELVMRSQTATDWARRLAEPFVVAVLYLLTGVVGLSLALPHGAVSPVWPPAGIAFAAVLLRGNRVWPGIWCGSFLINLWVVTHANHPLSLVTIIMASGVAAGSTLQALLGLRLIRWSVGPGSPLDRAQDVFRFVGISALSCTIAASVGVTSLCLGSVSPWTEFVYEWWTWWLGDSVGVMVVAPLLLTWETRSHTPWKLTRVVESLVVLVLLVSLGQVVFGEWLRAGIGRYSLTFTLIPFIVWAAFRFGQRGVATVCLVLSGIAIAGTIHGFGPFARETLNESLLLLQTFMAITTVTGLVLAAVLTERERIEQALQQANRELADRVQERTAALAKINAFLRVEITERQHAKEQLQAKNRDLETLLYVVSHDLKEPLRAIKNFSGLVHERYAAQLDGKGEDFLRRIVGGSERLERLLDDLLALSRAQRLERPTAEIDAAAVIDETLTRLEAKINETGAKIHVATNLPRLRADKTWATQAVYNLVNNALKFTRDGAVPEVEIGPYDPSNNSDPSDNDSTGVGLVVRDRGPGVEPEHAERIFQLFQRAVGREVEGTGAGLAIVRQIAERHGGRAWVQPRAGGGSEFFVTFGTCNSGAP
jgi:signal transduction histidine kinase